MRLCAFISRLSLVVLGVVATSTIADAETIELDLTFEKLARLPGAAGEDAFAVPPELVGALQNLGPDDELLLSQFPTGLGIREPLRLRRADLYAPAARVILMTEEGPRDLGPSRRLFFRGSTETLSPTPVALSLEPETRRLRGTVFREGEILELDDYSSGDAGRHALRNRTELVDTEMSCGSDLLDSRDLDNPFAGDMSPYPFELRSGGGMRQVVVAVDTDNEFMQKRFSNNQNAANDWIAELFNVMNVMYERDLDLHLAIGTVILRPSGQGDPYTGGSGASQAQLEQFGQYWDTHYDNIDRTFAMLLSGKLSSANGFSGIAWIDGFCETQKQGGGYSLNQVFTNPNLDISYSALFVGHELGHNLGSHHTHCYSPPIDKCANEGGCWGGATSCPGAGRGTVMSYCHKSSGCGEQNLLQLHSRVVDQMQGLVDAHYPGCVTNYTASPPPSGGIFSDGFESGGLGAWN